MQAVGDRFESDILHQKMSLSVLNMSKVCESCYKEHEEKYGSGRFCSLVCARCYSTKNKRKEINEKVSLKLKKNLQKSRICKCCSISFQTFTRSNTCSDVCRYKLKSDASKKGRQKC